MPPLPAAAVPAPRVVATAGWHVREEAIMGTAIRAELWADEPAAAHAALAAVMAEMHRIDAAMSPFKPESELSRINREAFGAPVALSAEMFHLLERAQQFSQLSHGAFDITTASVGHLYDYRRGIAPGAAALARAHEGIGWQHVQLDRARGTVRLAHAATRIDLGGFAKGHAVDNAAAILRRHGIAHAMVAAGGDSRILGDRRGRPWHVAIRDPRRSGHVVAVLPLEDTAMSTSGDYERCFIGADGTRCHHLIDPRSGRSPDHVQSVTILAQDGLTSEAWSKTLFVLGVKGGMELLEHHPGVDAVVVDAAGILHYSPGLLAAHPGGAAAAEQQR